MSDDYFEVEIDSGYGSIELSFTASMLTDEWVDAHANLKVEEPYRESWGHTVRIDVVGAEQLIDGLQKFIAAAALAAATEGKQP